MFVSRSPSSSFPLSEIDIPVAEIKSRERERQDSPSPLPQIRIHLDEAAEFIGWVEAKNTEGQINAQGEGSSSSLRSTVPGIMVPRKPDKFQFWPKGSTAFREMPFNSVLSGDLLILDKTLLPGSFWKNTTFWDLPNPHSSREKRPSS